MGAERNWPSLPVMTSPSMRLFPEHIHQLVLNAVATAARTLDLPDHQIAGAEALPIIDEDILGSPRQRDQVVALDRLELAAARQIIRDDTSRS